MWMWMCEENLKGYGEIGCHGFQCDTWKKTHNEINKVGSMPNNSYEPLTNVLPIAPRWKLAFFIYGGKGELL